MHFKRLLLFRYEYVLFLCEMCYLDMNIQCDLQNLLVEYAEFTNTFLIVESEPKLYLPKSFKIKESVSK